MKKLIFFMALLVALFFVGLQSSMIADKTLDWVKQNPQSPYAAEALYRAARWCDFLSDDDKAVGMYLELYQRYPERADLCAPGLYHLADIIVSSGVAKLRAKPYLEIVMNQYASVEEWSMKAKQLYDQLDYAH